ncbi:hypothetical protein Cni_G02376 [Canna indica]|uniref:Uncharacterized protein n=1 Tax=Canna indica TaxID=4628 RepID=A0AAQ3JQ08_9LILI|nr:hypothetical protein Cni_G02376 [Canna indica]
MSLHGLQRWQCSSGEVARDIDVGGSEKRAIDAGAKMLFPELVDELPRSASATPEDIQAVAALAAATTFGTVEEHAPTIAWRGGRQSRTWVASHFPIGNDTGGDVERQRGGSF